MILDGSDIPKIQRSRPERYPDDRYRDTYVKKVDWLGHETSIEMLTAGRKKL